VRLNEEPGADDLSSGPSVVVLPAALRRGERRGRWLRRHLRVLDLTEALDQAPPLLGLEDLAELLEIVGGEVIVSR
jgi:hypothetical protein